jgi:hypothetical protein
MAGILNESNRTITNLTERDKRLCGACPTNLENGGLCYGAGSTLKKGSTDAMVSVMAQPSDFNKIQQDGLCLKG